jgi:two-component system LytT family sensor kinase
LLLQPYLENAIWHGLMPLTDKGILKLEIKDYLTYIQITISDNGISRKISGEHAQLNPVKNKSFGVDITRKRIVLFSDKYTQIIEETIDVLIQITRLTECKPY